MMEMTLRMNRAPVPFRKTVTLVASAPAGPLFHDAWTGTGTADGRAADGTGQIWADYAAGSAANMTMTGAGAATSTPAAFPNAQAQAPIASFSTASIDFTTVFRIESDGGPPAGVASVFSGSEIGIDDFTSYIGFIVAEDGGGIYIQRYTYDDTALVYLASLGLNCNFSVPHTVVIRVRGAAVTILYDTVEVFAFSMASLSATYNYIYASVQAFTGSGYLPYLEDSLIEIP